MSNMPRSVGLLMGALGTSLLAPACSPENDIVATKEPARAEGGLSRAVLRVTQCRPGKYVGNFNSRSNNGIAQGIALNGTISFSLVELKMGEVALTVSSGSSLGGQSVQGQTFSADIDSHSSGCYEGMFHVNLIHGLFTYSDTATPFPFVGTVTGNYYLTPDGKDGGGSEGFIGSWQAFAGTSIDGGVSLDHGDWDGLWSGPN